MSRQRTLSLALLLLTFGLLILLVFLRMQLVDRNIGTYIACKGCFHSTVILSDLIMFSLVAGILLLAGLLRPFWLGRAVHLLLGALFLVYVSDLITFRLFNSRLFLADAALYISERDAVWDQYYTGLGGWLPAWGLLAGLFLMFLALPFLPPVRAASERLLLAAVLVVSLTAGVLATPPPFVNEWAVANVFSANLASSERVKYSPKTAAASLASPRQRTRFVADPPGGRAGNRNVIVILLESWSAWHSALFGGYEDWTPQLDAAARTGLRFTNFHSIGFSTDKGLVGILAGQQIWSPFLSWFETPPLHSMWGIDRTLPAVFAQHGYYTAFLTTGPLGLYQKGAWLRDLGFDLAEGNEHPFYAGQPRYAFGSAPDEALYTRALQWRATAAPPWLLVLETVTTHQPYTDPETGQNSLELAMKYADRAFGDFMRELGASGFFDHGVLAVISDHRSMTPIPAHELDALGANAHSLVPAFILGEGFGPDGLDGRVYSQSDLLPSFELWLGGTTVLDGLQTLMFGQPLAEPGGAAEPGFNCAFHSRGDLRGVVDVSCNRGRGQVRLDGDQTRFIDSVGLDGPSSRAILEHLASLRLEGLRRHEAQASSARDPEKKP